MIYSNCFQGLICTLCIQYPAQHLTTVDRDAGSTVVDDTDDLYDLDRDLFCEV